MPSARPACQPIIKSQLRTWLLSSTGGGWETPPSPVPACGVLWHNRSPTKQTCFIPSGFTWRVLRRLVFQSCRTRLCLNTLHARLQNGNATCSFMVPAGDVFTEARRSNQEEDIISFTVSHSGVSSRLWGRWPLFYWHVESPPLRLTLSILRTNGWCASGWLELRAISVAGDSLSCCVFTAHGPCPHSHQIADQKTSSGTEKWGWGGIDDGCFCVCTPGSDHAAAHIVTNLDL